MLDRRSIRGERRPVIVDLLISVLVASLIMAGLREAMSSSHGTLFRMTAALILFAIPVVAMLYGVASAIELRKGWLGSASLTGLIHAGLVLGSFVGLCILASVSPAAATLLIAAEGTILLWSATWV